MALIHILDAYGVGPLTGQQSAQRDWSPFLVHFTNWQAMAGLRATVRDQLTAGEVQARLAEADAASFAIVERILASDELRPSSPSQRDQMPACVCLSECNLAGLISHCERYGRFGFALRKADVFRAGGRPCLYLAQDEYSVIAQLGRGQPAHTPEGRLFGLSNVYVPPRGDNKIQDYTHEREWRVFGSLKLSEVPPVALLAPSGYAAALAELRPGLPIVPLDMLFQWGA